MDDLKGSHVVVTGAGGALGKDVVAALTAAGAKVSGLDRSGTEFSVDLADPGRVTAALDVARSERGPVFGLVHLAGGYQAGPVLETSAADMEAMMRLNVLLAGEMVRQVLPDMRKAKAGRIIAMGAFAALKSSANQSAYNASKAALISFMKSVAEEVKGDGVSVITLLPTTLDTPANRQAMPDAEPNRWVKTSRVAQLIRFLLGDVGADLNGAEIALRGRL
ncbi:MAG: SDR family NAD(P)-dependent oxidoreductase [Sulfobacillus sp.]